MNTNLQGNIGEAKAVEYFISQGYEVFLPFGTAAKCDMVVVKNTEIKRVSVKSTTMRSRSKKEGWVVRIRQSARGRETPFDPTTCDILLVYIVPKNKIVLVKIEEISSRTEIIVY